MFTATRTITLTYKDYATYLADRAMWLLPEEGRGRFGDSKAWKHEVALSETAPPNDKETNIAFRKDWDSRVTGD